MNKTNDKIFCKVFPGFWCWRFKRFNFIITINHWEWPGRTKDTGWFNEYFIGPFLVMVFPPRPERG